MAPCLSVSRPRESKIGSALALEVVLRQPGLFDDRVEGADPEILGPIGTMTVRVGMPLRRNLACEPFWPTSTEPCWRRTLATSSEEGRLGTLEGQAVDVRVPDHGHLFRGCVLKVELQRLPEV